MSGSLLRIGTRRSALARTQTDWVNAALARRYPELQIEIVAMETTGDKLVDAPLEQYGGKELFVKELEEALLDGRVDLAVHSLKDVPVALPPGLHLAAVCEREDPRDALVSPAHITIDQLPKKGRVGTSSLRRRAQLKAYRPDLEIVPIRGNVATRLGKIEREGLDGVILALAGLRRLGLAAHATEIIDVLRSVPAIGQGALGIECRKDDAATNTIVAALNHAESAKTAAAERGFLLRLGGGCQVPLGALATLSKGDTIHIHAFVGTPDGVRALRGSRTGSALQAEKLGRDLAEDLLDQGAGEILAALEAPPASRDASSKWSSS